MRRAVGLCLLLVNRPGTERPAGAATAAAAPTTGVVPAAVDEVSILTAAQFATHAARFQELHARAAELQAALSAALATSGGSYAATEAANAAAAH